MNLTILTSLAISASTNPSPLFSSTLRYNYNTYIFKNLYLTNFFGNAFFANSLKKLDLSYSFFKHFVSTPILFESVSQCSQTINYNYNNVHLTGPCFNLYSCTFISCSCSSSEVNPSGGAIKIVADSSSLENTYFSAELCNFTDCSSFLHGGALYITSNSDVIITKTNFTSCLTRVNTQAPTTSESLGGAIYCQTSGSLNLEGSHFSNCQISTTGKGGAVYSTVLEMNINYTSFQRCTISNLTESCGGAVYFSGYLQGAQRTLSLYSVKFSDCKASQGSSLYVSDFDLIMNYVSINQIDTSSILSFFYVNSSVGAQMFINNIVLYNDLSTYTQKVIQCSHTESRYTNAFTATQRGTIYCTALDGNINFYPTLPLNTGAIILQMLEMAPAFPILVDPTSSSQPQPLTSTPTAQTPPPQTSQSSTNSTQPESTGLSDAAIAVIVVFCILIIAIIIVVIVILLRRGCWNNGDIELSDLGHQSKPVKKTYF